VGDTIIFMDHDLEKTENLKVLLYAFEKLSGLKINFHKSEITALVRQRSGRMNTRLFLDAKVGHFHLNT
jgi:hypothetical protein